jgi:CheY-like chemotaxis protein
MPGTDGWEVLNFLKNDEKLRSIPVIVLTSSSDEIDIKKCYQAGANSYITKPLDFDSFIESLQLLKEYWFKISILPKG